MAVDFLGNIKYAQPLIYNKMLETQRIPRTSSKLPSLLFPLSKPPDQEINQPAIVSIADEITKLAKLREQGVITEEAFLQMKNNLMKRM